MTEETLSIDQALRHAEQMEAVIQGWQHAVATLRAAAAEQTVREAEGRRRAVEENINALNQQRDMARDAVATTQAQITAAQEAMQQLATATGDLATASANLQSLRADLAGVEAELTARRAELDTTNRDLKAARTTWTKEEATARRRLDDAKTEYEEFVASIGAVPRAVDVSSRLTASARVAPLR